MQFPSLDWKEALEQEMATSSSISREGFYGLQSMRSQKKSDVTEQMSMHIQLSHHTLRNTSSGFQ